MRILSTTKKSFCYAISPVGLKLMIRHSFFFFFGRTTKHLEILDVFMLISPCLLPIYCNFVSDIDECNTDFKSCHQKALCHNTQGSFTCSCKPGYEGDGYNCTGKILWLLFRLSLRGDWCHVQKSLREKKCVLNVQYIVIL